ncbi:hypothetical protein [Psychroserpens damuponensis]|uniref:hypothetical protein n=1 Tax=Psychroserpens damuponensis TaxID=943936 RepID=UPI0012699857|nr:hypothetical protein [Psychroserpens damuponensis]
MSTNMINANSVKISEDPFSDCFDLAISLYQNHLDSGRDRADALEMGAWAYDDCVDDAFTID